MDKLHILKTPLSTTKRQEYASRLELLAQEIRNCDMVPEAIYVQVFWRNQNITRFRHIDNDFNILKAVGGFECLKSEHLDEVRDSNR